MAEESSAETVDLPQIGRVKREYVWAAGALAVGIVAYAWWRHRASAAADATTPAVDTSTGSAGATGGSPPPITPVTPVPQGSGQPTDNQAWTQLVLDRMAVIGGTEEAFVLATIAKYLQGVPLTSDEIAVVREAWALAGKPPQGPDNFHVATGGSTPGTPAPPSQLPTVPDAVSGLHATSVTPSSITLAWSPSSGASSYVVQGESPYDHPDVVARSRREVTGTSVSYSGLAAPDTDHKFTIWAKNSAGQSAPATLTVHTSGHFVGPRPPVVDAL